MTTAVRHRAAALLHEHGWAHIPVHTRIVRRRPAARPALLLEEALDMASEEAGLGATRRDIMWDHLAAELYGGRYYDARVAVVGWADDPARKYGEVMVLLRGLGRIA